MASIMLDDFISDAELAKHRLKFEAIKAPNDDDMFQFALTLIRAKPKADIKEGFNLFQHLFLKTRDENVKRDTLYYMAVAKTKLGEYEEALKYLRSILNVQPSNEQVRELHDEVTNRMKKDGLIGMGIVGGAALVGLFGVVGLGAAMLAKRASN